jgi:hypothetical protein
LKIVAWHLNDWTAEFFSIGAHVRCLRLGFVTD